MLRRTHAATVFVYAEALFQVAHAVTLHVYHHVGLAAARHAIVIRVLTESRWTDAVAVLVRNLAFFDRTYVL